MKRATTIVDKRTGTLFALVAVLVAVPAVSGQSADRKTAQQLNRLAHKAIAEGNYKAAVARGHELEKLRPDAATPAYNLACGYSLLDDTVSAVQWLRKAAEKGFMFTATAMRDGDLDGIRGDPGYTEAMAMIRKNNAARLEALKPKINNAPLVIHIPAGYDGANPVPLIVALHPYGGRAEPIAHTWKEIAADIGAIVVAPQAHTRQAQGFAWGIMEHAEYTILNAIDRAQKKYNIDGERIVLTGFSQGSTMSFYVGLKHPDRIAGVIPVSGFYDGILNPIPPRVSETFPRFFIMNGALDAEAQNNRHVASALQSAGAMVELRIYDGIGHAFPRNRDAELRDAIRFVLE